VERSRALAREGMGEHMKKSAYQLGNTPEQKDTMDCERGETIPGGGKKEKT